MVPNLITSMAACGGITSIAICATNYAKALAGQTVTDKDWTYGLLALLAACICDALDGRVARLLKASSKLGAELDSLADFVNFGVAPAMFMYFWLTGGPTHEGMSPQIVRLVLGCSLFYAMCDCFRLARFNTMLEQPTQPYWKHFFTGVPAPGGCWMVLTPAILSIALEAKGKYPALADALQNPYFGMFALLFIGALMASRLPTISLKSVHISRRFQLPVMAALLLVVAFLISNFWMTIGVMGFLYLLTVPVTGLVFLKVRARALDAAAAKV